MSSHSLEIFFSLTKLIESWIKDVTERNSICFCRATGGSKLLDTIRRINLVFCPFIKSKDRDYTFPNYLVKFQIYTLWEWPRFVWGVGARGRVYESVSPRADCTPGPVRARASRSLGTGVCARGRLLRACARATGG